MFKPPTRKRLLGPVDREVRHMGELKCCFGGCGRKADFRIIYKGDDRYDVAETHACETHVGALLGSVPPVSPNGPWDVSIILIRHTR